MKRNPVRSILSALFAVMLAMTLAFGAAPVLTFADETDAVPAAGAEAQLSVSVSVEVAGEDGVAISWLAPTAIEVADGTSALEATLAVLDQAGMGYDTTESEWGTSLDAITNVDGTKLEMTMDGADYIYWQFLVNGAYSNIGSDSYALSAGDAITWHYGGSNKATNPQGPDYDTETIPEAVEIQWAGFEDGGNVTYIATPTSVTEDWATRVGGASGASELIIADDWVFVAVGSSWDPTSPLATYAMQLVKLDAETGAILATTPLAGDIDYTCRPIAEGGLIYIPLDGGSVQAVNMTTMKTYWVSAAAADGGQVQTTLGLYMLPAATGEYDENWEPVMDYRELLVLGTAVYDPYAASGFSSGSIVALDAETGAVQNEWAFANYEAGFYWTNLLEAGDYIVVADTAGVVRCISAGSYGAMELGSVELGDRVVSDLNYYEGDILAASGDGTLWRISVSEEGELAIVSSVSALSVCKSGPVVVGDTAFIGGVTADGTAAAVAVIDLTKMEVEQVISTADGEDLPLGLGGVSAPVLVSWQDDKVVCYFTVNYAVYDPDDPTFTTYVEGGNAYWFELGEDEAHLLYAPELEIAQYCDSPLVPDFSGNLYYLNDSGFVVKLVQAADEPSTDPEPPTPAGPTTDDSGKDDKGKQDDKGNQGNGGPGNAGPANQDGGKVPATGDPSVCVAGLLACATSVLGAAAVLRRKER